MKTLQHVSHVQLQSASACAVNLLACRRRLRSNSLSHVYLYQPVLYSVAVAFACVFCLLLFGLNVLRSRSVPSHRKTARASLQGYGLSGTTPSRLSLTLALVLLHITNNIDTNVNMKTKRRTDIIRISALRLVLIQMLILGELPMRINC